MSSNDVSRVRPAAVPTAGLEIPQELAYLLDLTAGSQPLHSERNWVNTVGRIPEDNEKPKLHLPGDINNYSLPNFFQQHHIQFDLGVRTSPLEEPIVPKPSREMTKKSLELFKLILRFTYDDNLSQLQDHLIGSYIVQMSMMHLELREEVYLQLMNQCVDNPDEVALQRTWLLIANLLSACKPVDRLERYVIKFVSDHGPGGFSSLCQHKCLSARPQCRLYPPCSLEWKANVKNGPMALNLRFVDGHEITVDVESFSVGDELARHALILRSDSALGTRGWSVALHFEEETIEPGGHSFVLDPIACLELRPEWVKIGGSDGSQFFLRSRKQGSQRPPETTSDGVLQPGVHPARLMAIESPRARGDALDSWLEDVFDTALTSERSDPHKVQGWIHGLGDQPVASNPVLPINPLLTTGLSTFPSPIYGMPDPFMSAQTAQLQAAITQAQLQNQLLQHNVQRELLVQQLAQLQASHPSLSPDTTVPLLMQQQPLQANFRAPQPPPQPAAAPQRPAGSPRASPKERPDNQASPASPANQSSRAVMFNFPENYRGSSSQQDYNWKRSSGRLASDSVFTENGDRPGRARPVHIGGVSWPPAESGVSSESKLPEPKRLVGTNPTPKSWKDGAKSPREAPKSWKDAAKSPREAPKSWKDALKPPKEAPKSPSKAPEHKNVKSTSVVIMTSNKEEQAATFTVGTDEVASAEERTASQRRIEEVREHRVNIADRAQLLASSLHMAAPEPARQALKTKASPPRTSAFFRERHTLRLDFPAAEARHYMFTLVPWQLELRKEVLSPAERADSPMLLDLLLAQIVFDALKRSCVRLSEAELQEMRKAIETHKLSADIHSLKKQPKQVKKVMVEKAKAAQFYFGRFHAAEWYNPSPTSGPLHWLVLNHTGIHLAYQTDDDLIHLVRSISFEEIYSIVKVDVRVLTISLHNNDRYDIICHMNASFVTLAQTFMKEAEQMKRATGVVNGALLQRSESKVSSLRNEIEQVFLLERSKERYSDVSAGLIAMKKTDPQNDYELRRLPEIPKLSLNENDFFMMPYIKQFFRAEHIERNPNDNLRWSKSPLRTSLHDIDCTKLAVEAFLAILTFTRNYPREKDTEFSDSALILLEIPTRHRVMVDEIFCQLIKQTRPVEPGVPSIESLLDCWRLFAFFAMFNCCSDALWPFLIRYLEDEKATRSKEEKPLIARILKNLMQSRTYGGRRILPLRNEVELELGGDGFKNVQLMTPSEKALVQLSQISVVKEVIDSICESIGIVDEVEKTEFTLFSVMVKDNLSTPLSSKLYIFDLLMELMGSGRTFYFFFCRTSWACELHLHARSEAYVRIMHRQLVTDYLSGCWMLRAVNEEASGKQANDMVHLAALQWRLMHPNRTHIPPEELRNVLPSELMRFQQNRDWYALIKPELKKLKRCKDLDCMREAIYILTKWFLFGSTRYFIATGKGSIFAEKRLAFLINRSGVILLEADSRKMLTRIPYSDILGYEISMIANSPSQIDIRLQGDRLLRFFSNQANKVVHILSQYMKVMTLLTSSDPDDH